VRVKITGERSAPDSLRELISRMARGRGPSVTVQRQELPYWQERGWTRNANAYTGRYQTQYASFLGEVVQHGGNHIEFFLYRPSEQIQNHSHWACFQHQRDGWYRVHMGRRPADVSSGILTIERLITEAYA